MAEQEQQAQTPEQQQAEFPKIDFDQLPDMRETISGIIGLLCYSDTDLRAMLLNDGLNKENLTVVTDKIRAFYSQIGKEAPDLSWMESTKFNIHKNDDNTYVIPLPHTE